MQGRSICDADEFRFVKSIYTLLWYVSNEAISSGTFMVNNFSSIQDLHWFKRVRESLD